MPKVKMTLQYGDRLYGEVNSGLLVDEQGNLVYAYNLPSKPEPYVGEEFVKVPNSLFESWKAGSFWSRVDASEVKKFSPDQPRDEHGRFSFVDDTAGGGGNSYTVPYPLVTNPDIRNTGNSDFANYKPFELGTHGPDGSAISTNSQSYGAIRGFEQQLFFESQKSDKGYYSVGPKEMQQLILAEPDYPKIPQDRMEAAVASLRWADGKTLADISNVDMPEVSAQALNLWKNDDPASWKEYITKENVFVNNWLGNQKLPDGTTIKETTDKFAQQSVQQITDIVKNGEVSLSMPIGRLAKFINDNEYKTAYDVNLQGKGSNRQHYLEIRENVEQFLGFNGKPIYGIIGNEGNPFGYGNSRIIFKDDIKDRTSWTLGDSIDGKSQGANWVQDTANGNLTSEKFLQDNGYMVARNMGNANWGIFDHNGATSSERMNSPILGLKSDWNITDMAMYKYIETQIHGGVTLSDVAKVVVPSNSSLSKSDKQILADNNIPIEIDASGVEKR